MPYIYSAVQDLVTDPPKPLFGDGHCVPLVQHYAKCPVTTLWKEGQRVRGKALTPGTAIATFVDKKYPQDIQTGKHAALYLSQDADGIWVVDQYKNSGGIKKRHLRWQGKNGDQYVAPSNNGDAFSVIE